uniref:Phosphatidylserine synthase n=1 Tax=Caenorhabditis tropicalis TaxID=1561998 RepID=A0A1I7UR61_9PELO
MSDSDDSNDSEIEKPRFSCDSISMSGEERPQNSLDDEKILGYTTDGENNRHTPQRKMSTILDRVELEKKHYDMINERIVDDVTMDQFYKPHSISVLVIFIACLIYKAAFGESGNSRAKNFYDGFIGAGALFLLISALTFPNGPFIRPHPILWRIIFGLSVIYIIVLQFALFQNYDDLKMILTWLDPEGLGQKSLEEKEYASDCWNLSFEKIWSHVDFFAFSHFTGWIMKTLLLRHWVLCWFISIIWEFTELMFIDLLPNFAECWWDSLILDVILCNGVGIYVGMKLCDFLEMRQFHWESIRNIKTRRGKMKRFALQFTPASWSGYDWYNSKSFSNALRRTFHLTFLVAFWLLAELNTFFIKHIFAIDTQHPVVFWRIILIAVIAAPTIRQFYIFSTDPLTRRVGMQSWVFVVICVLELAICVKCGGEVFAKINAWNMALWIASIIIGTIFCILASTWYAENFGSTARVLVKGKRRLCYLESSHENLGILQDDVIKKREEYLTPPRKN